MNYRPRASSFETWLHRDAASNFRVGTISVADVNAGDHASFALGRGNDDGVFTLDPASGVVRVSSGAALATAPRAEYALEIQVTDDGKPPLAATATALVRIAPTNAITTTLLHHEVWTNIAGVAVEALTDQAGYPGRPHLLRPLERFALSRVGAGRGIGDRGRAACSFPRKRGFTRSISLRRGSAG